MQETSTTGTTTSERTFGSSTPAGYVPASGKVFSADRLEEKAFSLQNRFQSVTWSFKGFLYLIRHTHALWMQFLIISIFWVWAAVVGCSSTEWALLIMAGFCVFITECVNTAIEIAIDRISTKFHELSGLAKDVAAGAVMMAALMAFIVALVILLPKTL